MLAGILGHVALPLPHRGGDRVPAQPARARPAAAAAAARARGGARLPPLRRRGRLRRARARQRRRRPDPLGRPTGSTTTSRSTDAGGKTGAEQDIDRLQHWLDTHGLERIQIQKQATDWADNLGAGEISKYTQDAISFAQGAAFSIVVTLFNLVLIVVIAIYMLLDMERLERLDRPPLPARATGFR